MLDYEKLMRMTEVRGKIGFYHSLSTRGGELRQQPIQRELASFAGEAFCHSLYAFSRSGLLAGTFTFTFTCTSTFTSG
jgi:hypothetical protein